MRENARKEIEKAIDIAWTSADSAIKEKQKQLFPEGKPTPELFIFRIAAEVEKLRRTQ